jgi:formylglycine-generating enzyme
MAFQLIPAGSFQMGNTGGHNPERDTEPVHSVELDALWIGVHPVTHGQFQAFAAATGYQTIRERRPAERPYWTDFASPGREDYPVVAVN